MQFIKYHKFPFSESANLFSTYSPGVLCIEKTKMVDL